MKQIRTFLKVFLFAQLGTCLGRALWLYVDYRRRPALYEMQSAPWYTGALVTAAFTAGFGSEKGPGYLLRTEPATLESVPPDEKAALEDEAASLVREGLARAFPGRDLRVERDGGPYKIFGDLSLG